MLITLIVIVSSRIKQALSLIGIAKLASVIWNTTTGFNGFLKKRLIVTTAMTNRKFASLKNRKKFLLLMEMKDLTFSVVKTLVPSLKSGM